MSESATASDIEAFRRDRLMAVKGPMGDAALVGTHWISGRVELDGFPGLWALAPDAANGLIYTPPSEGAVIADGSRVVGSLVVAPVAEGGSVLHHGPSLRATVLRWPGLGLAVRLWDAADPSAAGLVAIDSYPHDPDWRIVGRYVSHQRRVDYEYHGHGGRSEGRHVVGELAITVGGRDYMLLVTRNAAGLTTVFGDATNGIETYGGGRFVSVTEAGADSALVDFNQATLPPCAFSAHFDCPLPPPQNVMKCLVPAGEKRIVRC